MVLRKSFYILWSAGRSRRVHEVNSGRDPSIPPAFERQKAGIKFPRFDPSEACFDVDPPNVVPQKAYKRRKGN